MTRDEVKNRKVKFWVIEMIVGKKMVILYVVLVLISPILAIGVSVSASDVNNSDFELDHEMNAMVNPNPTLQLMDNNRRIITYDNLKLEFRKVSNQELELIKSFEGESQEGMNYNQVIEGHGTGLKPLTKDDWAEFGDRVNVIEEIITLDSSGENKRFGSTMQLSSSVDHTSSKYFPPIGNQGYEGSCVCFAVGYYTKTFQEAKEHDWDLSGANWTGGATGNPTTKYQDKIMSPEFIYHQINGGVDRGSYYSSAMDLCHRIGVSSWKEMPYSCLDHTSWPAEDAWREAPLYRTAQGYNYLWIYPPYNSKGMKTLKTWLDNDNLAVISVDAYKYSKLNSNDLWTNSSYTYPSTNHANTVVGYDDNFGPYYENNQWNYGAFKVANSWGTGWTGDNNNDGCYWISYECMKFRVGYCFMFNDRLNYEPELISVFELDHNYRGECNITVGMGSILNSTNTKRFDDWYNDYDGGDHPFPNNNMVLDITELNTSKSFYGQNLFLKVYDYGSATNGTIKNFTIEHYNDYKTGIPQGLSKSNDPPISTVNMKNTYAQVKLSQQTVGPVQNLDTHEFFNSIQRAISDPNTRNGHTIKIDSGIFNESIVIDKSLEILGNGVSNTTVNGSGNGDVIHITADEVRLSGMMVKNSGSSRGDSGIELNHTSDCSIENIDCSNTNIGISLKSSTSTTISNNILPSGGILIEGDTLDHWNSHEINDQNQIEAKPVIYVRNTNSKVIPLGAGQIILANCTEITIERQDLHDVMIGVQLGFANNNTIENNKCSATQLGILLEHSEANTISKNNISGNVQGIVLGSGAKSNNIFENTIADNSDTGITIESSSGNNQIFRNNFISNNRQALDEGNNYWNNKANDGNFWSNYQGQDIGDQSRRSGDGIGDTNIPHLGLDYYPFINQSGWLAPGIPSINDPGELNSDGNYSIIWLENCRTTMYILEEDVNETFDSPTIVYEGQDLGYELNGKTNGSYYYRLKAVSEQNESPWSNIVNITVDWLPDIPLNLAVSVFPEGNALNLSWEPNHVDTSEYLLFYRSEVDWELLETIKHPGNSYNHSGLIDGEAYSYKLQARDGRGQLSNVSKNITAIPEDSVAPAPPSEFTITDISSNSIMLTWTASSGDDVQGYNIYRASVHEPHDWGEPINGDSIVTDGKYNDINLDELTTYFYVITVLDEVPNESEFSETISALTPLAPRAPEVNESVAELKLTEDSCDYTSINLFRMFKDLNDDPLSFSCSGQKNIEVTIFQENGTVVLKPKHNWNGFENLTFFASDGSAEVSANVMITVTPVNDPPVDVTILKPANNIHIKIGKALDFEGGFDDPDIQYGDELSFEWFSNIMGKLGEDKVLEDILLSVGHHQISFQVTDSGGLGTIETIHVFVHEQVQRDSEEPDEVETGDEPKEVIQESTEEDIHKENVTSKEEETSKDEETTKEDDTHKSQSGFGAVVGVVVIIIVIIIISGVLIYLKMSRRSPLKNEGDSDTKIEKGSELQNESGPRQNPIPTLKSETTGAEVLTKSASAPTITVTSPQACKTPVLTLNSQPTLQNTQRTGCQSSMEPKLSQSPSPSPSLSKDTSVTNSAISRTIWDSRYH